MEDLFAYQAKYLLSQRGGGQSSRAREIQQLTDLGFLDLLPLLLSSLFFMVAGMLMLILSWRSRKHEKAIENGSAIYYVLMGKGTTRRSDMTSPMPNRINMHSHRDGLHFKRVFFDFISITCFLRALGCLVVLTNKYQSSLYWVYIVSLSLPSLLFITTLSLFIYFFALIVMEEESDSTNLLKPFFMVFNGFTYFAFFVICIFYRGQIYFENDQFLKATCGVYGVVYLIFAICMTNYGTRLYLILQNLQDHNESQDDKEILKALGKRVIVMTIIFSLVFGVRAVHNLLFTWGLIPRFYPQIYNKVAWDSIFTMLYEFLPVILIMILSKRDAQRFLEASQTSINRSSKAISDDNEAEENNNHQSEESDESFGNFNPNLKDHLLEKSSRSTNHKVYY
ncbi:hypothetical protein FGO68_gene17573 [Halteria grandinella]|uniref:THH1/TOM1/TOM3 domain-containing protein n=1 Tax=Halteria grandinella TaxID=5974 RepID=A0A8J8T906_HALGN|nr:hypothetical protein FGO68_gene17573 [Halteria grandinella]